MFLLVALLVRLAQLELKANLVQAVILVSQEHQDILVLVSQELLVILATLVSQEHQAIAVSAEQVVIQESVEQVATLAFQAQVDILDTAG